MRGLKFCQRNLTLHSHIKPIVWNGDATNCEETREDLVRIFLNPPVPQADYGAEMPYLFCPGNHDYRGLAGRNLEVVWPFRPAEERAPRDWDLGRNFAVRIGDIALVGLDSGETRLDDDPREAGLLACEPYRIAQTDWLRDALRREDIASAPFLVAFSHVPLLDDDGPAFSREESLAWQKTCAWQWRPLLDEAGCQLVIAAHWHKYQTFPPTDGHPWLQIIGGGPEMGFLGSGDDRQPAPDRFPTVIEGESRDGRLHITVHNLLSGRVQETFSFGPRRRK